MNRQATRYAVCTLLLLCGVAGCRHAPPPAPPVAATPPPLTPSSITVITPLPSVPPEAKANVRQAPVEEPKPAPAPVVVKRTRRLHHKPSPAVPVAEQAQSPAPGAGTAAAPPAGTTTAPASSTATTEAQAGMVPTSTAPTTAEAAAPALGELSAGTAISGQERVRMLGQIQAQEARVGKMKEPSTDDGRAIQMQVRAFLAKARQAVAENDLDGAQTLNTKAHVLLDELESE